MLLVPRLSGCVCVCVCVCISHLVMSNSLQPYGLSVEFSRQEYWSGLPFPSPGDLPDAGTELKSPALQADTLPTEPPGKPLAGIYWVSPKVFLGFQ